MHSQTSFFGFIQTSLFPLPPRTGLHTSALRSLELDPSFLSLPPSQVAEVQCAAKRQSCYILLLRTGHLHKVTTVTQVGVEISEIDRRRRVRGGAQGNEGRHNGASAGRLVVEVATAGVGELVRDGRQFLLIGLKLPPRKRYKGQCNCPLPGFCPATLHISAI